MKGGKGKKEGKRRKKKENEKGDEKEREILENNAQKWAIFCLSRKPNVVRN